MKIGLIDVDGHNFPNLALMKISAYHKARSDIVGWYDPLFPVDKVYMSKVFTFTSDYKFICCDNIERGGSGYDLHKTLPAEIDGVYPDYSLYGIRDTAYGYITRGCPRRCSFCIVSEKEGDKTYQAYKLSQFLRGQKHITLLDANLSAAENCVDLLLELAESGAYVNFSQGLDLRLLTDAKIEALIKIKTSIIHFAWDKIEDEKVITENLKHFIERGKYGCQNICVYVLTNYDTTFEEDLHRIYKLRDLGANPSVMIYNKEKASGKLRHLQRWCNNRRIFHRTPRFEIIILGGVFMINTIIKGDCFSVLKTISTQYIDCCVTSPPYYRLRDYGVEGQVGLEDSPYEYIERLISIFGEVKRVLKDCGTLWVNIGDTYNGGNSWSVKSKGISIDRFKSKGIPIKSLLGIPFRFALRMIEEGWVLRQDIIWLKPRGMPESVTDRFTRSHEYLFLFTKCGDYYFDHEAALEPAAGYDGRGIYREVYFGEYEAMVHKRDALQTRRRWAQIAYSVKGGEAGVFPQFQWANIEAQPMRTKRDVWSVASEPSSIPHFAMFPQGLIKPCIECGCPEGGIVLDPFMGAETTAVVSKKLKRNYIGCELNSDYIKIAERRIADINPLFDGIEKVGVSA